MTDSHTHRMILMGKVMFAFLFHQNKNKNYMIFTQTMLLGHFVTLYSFIKQLQLVKFGCFDFGILDTFELTV